MKKSEIQFQQMIDEIPALAWSCLPDGSVELISKQWLKYAGISHESSQVSLWESQVHQDDVEKLDTTWRQHLATCEPLEIESRLRRYDGTYRWFLIRAIPLRDALNRIIRWYGTNTDKREDSMSKLTFVAIIVMPALSLTAGVAQNGNSG